MTIDQNVANDERARDDHDVPRGVTIQLRVTEAERDAMKAAADRSGLTLSEWIRQRCLVTKTTIEAPVIKPTKRRR